MSDNIQQKLIENISVILKKSLTADATLADLRTKKLASFDAIFKTDAGFSCQENTFQPYVEEIANELLEWQQSQDQVLLIALVKKIEQLFTVLSQFEQSYAK
jgi:hypothetical protein